MVVALPLLADIIFWVGALIFCYLCVQIAKALFGVAGGTLGRLPIVGGWIDSSLHSVEHKITHVMGGAAATCDRQVGHGLHALARLVDWVGRELRSHANLLSLLSALVIGAVPATVLRTLIAELRRAMHGTHATAVTAATRIIRVQKVIQHGIGEDVLPRIKSLDRELGRVIGRDIPRIRAREAALEREVSGLWRWAHRHAVDLAAAAFVAPVAVALARLGGSWIRCSNWNKIGRSVCGLPAGLVGELFADAVTAIAVLDICDFAAGAELVAEQLTPILMGLVDVENALVGCHGATAAPELQVAELSLPAPFRTLALAA